MTNLHNLHNFILKLIHEDQGQDLTEYALLTGFIAVAAGATIPDLAGSVSTIFSKMVSVTDLASTA